MWFSQGEPCLACPTANLLPGVTIQTLKGDKGEAGIGQKGEQVSMF